MQGQDQTNNERPSPLCLQTAGLKLNLVKKKKNWK